MNVTVPGSNCASSASLEAELEHAGGDFISTHTETVLCEKAESICASANVRPVGKNIVIGSSPSAGKFLIKGGNASVKCSYSVINWISTAEFGDPLPGKSEVGVYPQNCQPSIFGTEACTSMTFNSPKETFEATGSGNGVIYLGSKSEPLTVSYTCLMTLSKEPVKCSYQAVPSIPIHYDGYEGTIKSAESAMSLISSNGYCGSTGSLEATLVNGFGGAGSQGYISTI